MNDHGKFADLAVSASRYERLELVGTGSFGEVYRGYGFYHTLTSHIRIAQEAALTCPSLQVGQRGGLRGGNKGHRLGECVSGLLYTTISLITKQ